MLTIKGVYRDGKVELSERPPEAAAEVPVLVTFLTARPAGEDEPSPSLSDAARARREAGERLIAMFEKGIDLGGPPYPRREDLYDRVGRLVDRLEQTIRGRCSESTLRPTTDDPVKGVGMTRSRRSVPLALAAAIGVLMPAAAAAAQEGKPKVQAGRVPETLVLFDGKDLEGWKKVDFFATGAVKVEDGAIVMEAGRSMTGITSTRKDLPATDYELSYEAMRLSGHDFFAAATFPVGASFITLVNGGWGGSVTGLSSLDGIDASENETTQSVTYKEKTWHRFRVRVTAEVIRCWIDERLIVAVNHQGRKVGTRIEVRRNQPLGFATWETTGALRAIRIRPLTPAEVAEANKLEE